MKIQPPHLPSWLSIKFEQTGFRDVHWCNNMSEPQILKYKDGKRHCDWCNGWDDEDHPFICHIKKGVPRDAT